MLCGSCGSSPRSREADTPQHKSFGCADLQTSFIFSIYYSLVLLELSFLLNAIYVCTFLLFLLSLNIFNICFQWFMLLLPMVCFLSQVLLHNPAHALLYLLLFCKLGILYLCHFGVVLFHIPYVQSNFHYIFYVICVTFLYIFFRFLFVLLYSSCLTLFF